MRVKSSCHIYSTYGHVHRMALAVAEGAESVPDITVRLRRIAELEEARKALSAQDAYVRAQQAQADSIFQSHICRNNGYWPSRRSISSECVMSFHLSPSGPEH